MTPPQRRTLASPHCTALYCISEPNLKMTMMKTVMVTAIDADWLDDSNDDHDDDEDDDNDSSDLDDEM